MGNRERKKKKPEKATSVMTPIPRLAAFTARRPALNSAFRCMLIASFQRRGRLKGVRGRSPQALPLRRPSPAAAREGSRASASEVIRAGLTSWMGGMERGRCYIYCFLFN